MKYLSGSILLLFFYVTNVIGQQKTGSDCSMYHIGKFVYTDSSGNLIRIKRTKNFQTEYDDSKDIWVSGKIKWLSDCEYEIEQTSTNSKSKRKNNHGITHVVISKQISADEYEYTISCACNDANAPKQKGTMKRMIN